MRVAAVLVAVLLWTGCSVKRFAVNKLGDALSGSGTTFASDDDPEFVASAVPFSLKLIESLLAESPRHRGLLSAAASGFTQYSYAFVQQPADEAEDQDVERATALRVRARRLFLRARGYGIRGLETRHPGLEERLRKDTRSAMAELTRRDVTLMYWTAAAWGSAITLSKDNPELVADQPLVEALIDRALELDESFDSGSLHSFLISYEPSRPGGEAGAAERARKHMERAVELSGGRLASPFVGFAETICVEKQDKKEFETLLKRALEIDADAKPDWRLANLVAQRRARWLLGREERLFLE